MYKQLEQIKNQSSEQRNAVLHKLMEKSEENKNKLLFAIENFEKCNKSTEITDLQLLKEQYTDKATETSILNFIELTKNKSNHYNKETLSERDLVQH